jgi:epidermal growth factor receptor substrate 15
MATSGFQLTAAERPTYAHLFALADPQSTGMVNGSAAVSFFALSGLPTPVLGSIWSIADSEGNGFLGPPQFSAALRLIGHAQNGKVVTEDLVKEAGPIPTFKGITIPGHLTGGGPQTPSRAASAMIQPQSTGGGTGFGTSEIKPEDRARYTRIFTNAGPQSGLLDGES